jgi:hypothetical protein
MIMLKTLPASLFALIALPTIATAYQTPIQLIIDNHADPLGGPPAIQEAAYLERVGWAAEILDECISYGAKISFLSTGQFMEWVYEDSDPTRGKLFIENVITNGGAIGTHSHRKYRIANHAWIDLPAEPTMGENYDQWNDHDHAMENVLQAIYGPITPSETRAINIVRGCGSPDNEPEIHKLLQAFGYTIREQGPDQEFYGYFEHYVWNPYRPSSALDTFLVHEPAAIAVLSPMGSSLSFDHTHFNIYQEMRVSMVKARFLMELLNWLDDRYVASTDRIWSSGWASHCHELNPADGARDDWTEALGWFTTNFIDETVSGLQAAEWSSMKESADLYIDWESTHPMEVPFTYSQKVTDENEYPYLLPTWKYLTMFDYVTEMPEDGTTRWHKVENEDGNLRFVLYSTTDLQYVADLSDELPAGTWAAVEPRNGYFRIIDPTVIPIRNTGTILVPVSDLMTFDWFGDFNEDGSVGVSDLLSMIELWGNCPSLPETCHEDLNGDGIVNVSDILDLISNWG